MIIQELIQGLIKKKDLRRGVKVLGSGSLTKALKVCLKCSRIAKEKIIKAGGKVENE